jgi:hypothetical protein
MGSKTHHKEDLENFDQKELDLIDAVRSLIKQKKKFRVKARMHSHIYGNQFYPGMNEINILDYKVPPTLDTKTNILTISPGYRQQEIKEYLKPFGLRLIGVTETYDVTIGGAVIVGAHNGSDNYKCLAEYVKEMWIIDGTGKIHCLTDPKLFINYGTLGVIFRIKIQCFEAKNVIWTHKYFYGTDYIDVDHDTHSVVFGPYSGVTHQTKLMNTDYQSSYSIWRYLWIFIRFIVSFNIVVIILEYIIRIIPWIGIPISEFSLWEPAVIRDRFDYYDYIPDQPVYTMEYSIDQKVWKKCHAEMMDLIKKFYKKGIYVTYRYWCRFIGKTDMFQALAQGRNSCLMELTFSKNQSGALEMAHAVNQLFLKFGGKPHMGKTILEVDACQNYDFTHLRTAMQEYDPHRLCINEFAEKVFYGKKDCCSS